MTPQGDPHRTLGIAAGASVNEIKSAYRRLAKKYHPDAAGERALPRFLAIRAAYELLVDGEGKLRLPVSTSKPSRTDPNRPKASRDAWRARRSGPGAADAEGPNGDGEGATPGARAEAPRRERPHREQHARHGPRKATPGSTTYDEAAELPLDPEWDGGAWYGPSSGTFWTINPKEYADPRKHGPEYQARARRAAKAERAADIAAPADAGARAGADPGPAGPDDPAPDAP